MHAKNRAESNKTLQLKRKGSKEYDLTYLFTKTKTLLQKTRKQITEIVRNEQRATLSNAKKFLKQNTKSSRCYVTKRIQYH